MSNLKVLQVITSLSTGGAEKLIIDSIVIYQNEGIEADVLSLKNTKTPFWKELEKNTLGSINGLTSKSVYNPFLIFKIIPYLKKYDIIHLHLFPTLYWVILAKIISFSNVKVVYTEHSTNNRRRNILLFKWLDRFFYNKLDKIVCITNGVKVNLVKHLKEDKNILVINNGINTKLFVATDSVNKYDFFDKEDFKLIQVSSFRVQKDQATIIRSLKLLPENIKLLLVGEGVLIEEHKAMVEKLNLSNRVLFLGNRYDIPALINYCDVSLLSSNWEGFGLAILEGMAAGKPVIASNVDGIKEIVEGYGLLFEQGNENELAKLIRQLMENQDVYQKIAIQCLERTKNFTIENMVNKYITVYKEM